MYRWVIMGCAGALLATGGVATYATAPDAYKAHAYKAQTSSGPSAIHQAGLSNGARLLLYTSLAERLIYRGDYDFAAAHLNAAMTSAARLPTKEKPAPFNIFRIALITLQDDAAERQILIAEPTDLAEPLNFSPEALPLSRYSIRNAEIYYLTGDGWDKAAILTQLQHIAGAVGMGKLQESGKPTRVSEDFASLHELLLATHAYPVSARRAAMDEIALARALLQLQAYDAAKGALSRADGHIQRLHNNDLVGISSEIANALQNMDVKQIKNDEKTPRNALDKQLAHLWETLS